MSVELSTHNLYSSLDTGGEVKKKKNHLGFTDVKITYVTASAMLREG